MKRKIFISTIILALSLWSISAFSETREKQTPSLRIACVGDSITYGGGGTNSYPAQLGRLLEGRATVRNFGVNGATLLKQGNKPYWDQEAYKSALEFKPDMVVIKLGTNDSKPPNWKYKSDFVSNYVELVKSFQRLESKPMIWICYPAPAYSDRWGISDQVMREEATPMIDEVAELTTVKIIDLYSVLLGKSELFPDGIHPNAAGAKIIAETVGAALTGRSL